MGPFSHSTSSTTSFTTTSTTSSSTSSTTSFTSSSTTSSSSSTSTSSSSTTSSSSSSTCPAIPSGPQYGVDNIVGSLTFHDLTIILCAVFAGVTFLLSGVQLWLHATHFSNPGQQTKILRIIALVPTFALFYLLAGAIPSAAIYLQPWAMAYEAVALVSYFLLIVTYAVPDPLLRERFFERLQAPKGGKGSLKLYHRTWYLVFQYVPVSFIIAVATDATQATGTFCVNGNSVHFAHIWLTVIQAVSVGLSVIWLLRFYRRVRPEVQEHAVVPKLFAIKGIVLVSTLQNVVFMILSSTSAGDPSSKLSYDDIYYGIPSILICGEMMFFSLFTWYAYSVKPYNLSSSGSGPESPPLKNNGGHYQGGFMGVKALLAALNPMEIVSGLGLAVRYLFSRSPSPQPQGSGDLPLQQNGTPPPYGVPPISSNNNRRHRAPADRSGEHNPNPVEYGHVDRD